MGEAGPGDEAAGGAEDATGFGAVDLEGHDFIVAGRGSDGFISGAFGGVE